MVLLVLELVEHLEKEYGFKYKDLNTLCRESEAIFLALKEWLKDENHFFFGDTLPTIGDEKLWKLPNTYTINRSAGGKSYEAYYRLGEKVLNNIKDYLR